MSSTSRKAGCPTVVYMVFFAELTLPGTHRCDVILRAILVLDLREAVDIDTSVYAVVTLTAHLSTINPVASLSSHVNIVRDCIRVDAQKLCLEIITIFT